MAKNVFLDWSETASNNTDIGGISILGTAAVSNFDDAFRTAMAQLRAGVDGEVVYAAKSGNYTAVANDNNGYMRFTAAATLSLTAVATLGANWHLFVQADGGDVLVDPNASETINGATTINIRNGESALIISTGSVFFARINPAQTVYASKSGNYTAVAADNGAVHRYTATATVSLTAAATLGSSWNYTVVANGGTLTIDPNSSETINGQTTMLVPDGTSAKIICDGSNFYTVFKPTAWEVIGVYNPSAVSTLDITNLGSFKFLRASGALTLGTAALSFRTSTNNGSSFDAGASDYTSQTLSADGTTVVASSSTASSGAITLRTSSISLSFETLISNWDAGGSNCFLTSKNTPVLNTGVVPSEIVTSKRNDTTARNAIRFLPSTGTITGTIVLEGIRG